jgi:SAM-dependent methyltransferase
VAADAGDLVSPPAPSDPRALKAEVLAHFEELAPEYDGYKLRNSYYYDALKRLLADLVLPAGSVAEIGCGTGDLLASLAPSRGLGLDLSPSMIELARRKHSVPGLRFEVGDAEELPSLAGYEAVFLADVVEHLADLEAAVCSLARAASPGTRLVLTWANHLWTPVLDLAERLGLKMPEGPHAWFAPGKLVSLLEAHGFEVVHHETRLLCPVRLWGLGTLLNRTLGRLPLLRRLGVIRALAARRRG